MALIVRKAAFPLAMCIASIVFGMDQSVIQPVLYEELEKVYKNYEEAMTPFINLTDIQHDKDFVAVFPPLNQAAQRISNEISLSLEREKKENKSGGKTASKWATISRAYQMIMSQPTEKNPFGTRTDNRDETILHQLISYTFYGLVSYTKFQGNNAQLFCDVQKHLLTTLLTLNPILEKTISTKPEKRPLPQHWVVLYWNLVTLKNPYSPLFWDTFKDCFGKIIQTKDEETDESYLYIDFGQESHKGNIQEAGKLDPTCIDVKKI